MNFSSLVKMAEEEKLQEKGSFGDEEDEEILPEDDSADVWIKFEVYHEDILLGEMLQKATKFIDLEKT